MDLSEQWFLLLGTMAYMVALALTVVRLSKRRPPMHGLNLVIILGGWLLQSIGLWMLGTEAASCPIRNPFEVLQFVSWSIVILYLFTGQVFRLSLFGTGSASLAAIISVAAYLIPGAAKVSSASLIGGDPRINAHAALALFSYGIFGLLAVLSVLYVLQNNSLKNKKNAGIFRFLPSIVDMDAVLMRLLVTACIVYTVSVSIGAQYWREHLDEVALPKLITTFALLIAYWLVLFLRATNKLLGTRLAWSCIGLLIAALLILWPVEASRGYGKDEPITSQSQP